MHPVEVEKLSRIILSGVAPQRLHSLLDAVMKSQKDPAGDTHPLKHVPYRDRVEGLPKTAAIRGPTFHFHKQAPLQHGKAPARQGRSQTALRRCSGMPPTLHHYNF